MARAKRNKRRRKTHVDTLVELVQQHRGERLQPPHQVLQALVRERRAEKLLLKELRKTIRKWAKQPSKLPRYEVARRWSRLLKM